MSITTASPGHGDLTTTNAQLEQAAREYVQGLRALQVHAAVFAVAMILIFLVNSLTNVSAGITGDWEASWSKWAFLGWAIGISAHGLVDLAPPSGRYGKARSVCSFVELGGNPVSGRPGV